MGNIVCYKGEKSVSLGLMQDEYVPVFMKWINRHTDVIGTNLRPPYTEERGFEWLRWLDTRSGQDEVFAILLNETSKQGSTDRYVGHVGIHNIQWPSGIATVGIVVGTSDNQKRGFGSEAMLLLLYHGFRTLGLRKLVAMVKAFNAPSMGHLLKCGYRIIGKHKEHILCNGRYVDEIIFEVFRDDWENIWHYYSETGVIPKLSESQRDEIKHNFVPLAP